MYCFYNNKNNTIYIIFVLIILMMAGRGRRFLSVTLSVWSNLCRCTATSQRPGCWLGTAMTRCPAATRRWRRPPSSPSWPPPAIWLPCWRCCPSRCHRSRARCYCGRCCCCNSNGGL